MCMTLHENDLEWTRPKQTQSSKNFNTLLSLNSAFDFDLIKQLVFTGCGKFGLQY